MDQRNLEKLCKTMQGTGYGDKHNQAIAENLQNGVKEFTRPDSFRFGEDRLDVELRFGPTKKGGDGVYLTGVDTLLQKDIKIPQLIIGGLDTYQLEARLKNPPSEALVTPETKMAFQDFQQHYIQDMERDLKVLLEKSPEIFNLVWAKYQPPINITIPLEMQEQQATIVNDHLRTNLFSSYFNLTPLEMYSMLNDRAVNKTLFKTGENQVQRDVPELQDNQNANRFNTWLKIDREYKNADGSHNIRFIGKGYDLFDAMMQYNFEELKSEYGRLQTSYFLKKGSLMKVHNLNEKGEREVLIEANPEFKKGLKVYKLDGTLIRDHNNYLKEPLEKKVGEYVELVRKERYPGGSKTASQSSGNNDPVGQVTDNSGEKNTTEGSKKKVNDPDNNKSFISKLRGRNKQRVIQGDNKGNKMRR